MAPMDINSATNLLYETPLKTIGIFFMILSYHLKNIPKFAK